MSNQYLPFLGLLMFAGIVGGLGVLSNYLRRDRDITRQRRDSDE